ncbi:UDP-N-acetylmuramate--L-alanine ligase, partial [hydrothermal vent metagenome]
LDHYGSFDKIKDAFLEFIENVPFYGAAILCIDHPEVQAILPRIRDRRLISYGFSAQADVKGINVTPIAGGNRFDVVVTDRDGEARTIEAIELPMPGRHNVQNAIAAVAVGLEMGMTDDQISKGFDHFGGVKRRFTKVGEVDGASIIDDYAHHPVEIRAVLSAAREGTQGRVIAVVQPHRFTRLRDHMEEFQQAFNDADMVYVTPVYVAGEYPIEGVDSEALAVGLRKRGHRVAEAVADHAELTAKLAEVVQDKDMIVCLGAGDITKWAAGLELSIKEARE